MLQQVLARPHWADRLTPRDRHAVTPLIWDHVNPYGRYEHDIDSRIPILADSKWRLVTRRLELDQPRAIQSERRRFQSITQCQWSRWYGPLHSTGAHSCRYTDIKIFSFQKYPICVQIFSPNIYR